MTQAGYHFTHATGTVSSRKVSNVKATQDYVARVSSIRWVQGVMVVVRKGGSKVYVGTDARSALAIVTMRNHLQTV